MNTYIDPNSKPKIKSAKYCLKALDYCGMISELAVPHKTIHLSINLGKNNSINLIWEPYEGLTIATYYIHMVKSDHPNFTSNWF